MSITRLECLKGAKNVVKVRARTPGPGVYDKYVWSILKEGEYPWNIPRGTQWVGGICESVNLF